MPDELADLCKLRIGDRRILYSAEQLATPRIEEVARKSLTLSGMCGVCSGV